MQLYAIKLDCKYYFRSYAHKLLFEPSPVFARLYASSRGAAEDARELAIGHAAGKYTKPECLRGLRVVAIEFVEGVTVGEVRV